MSTVLTKDELSSSTCGRFLMNEATLEVIHYVDSGNGVSHF